MLSKFRNSKCDLSNIPRLTLKALNDTSFFTHRHGSTMVKLDVNVENGGMTLDKEFLVDFGSDKDDILLAHEMR